MTSFPDRIPMWRAKLTRRVLIITPEQRYRISYESTATVTSVHVSFANRPHITPLSKCEKLTWLQTYTIPAPDAPFSSGRLTTSCIDICLPTYTRPASKKSWCSTSPTILRRRYQRAANTNRISTNSCAPHGSRNPSNCTVATHSTVWTTNAVSQTKEKYEVWHSIKKAFSGIKLKKYASVIPKVRGWKANLLSVISKLNTILRTLTFDISVIYTVGIYVYSSL